MERAPDHRERIASIIASSKFPVAYTDQYGTVRRASSGYHDAFGSHVVGRTIADLTHPDDGFAVALQRALLDPLSPATVATFVKRYVHTVTGAPVQALVHTRVRLIGPGTVELAWPTAWTTDAAARLEDSVRSARSTVVPLSAADVELCDIMVDLFPMMSGSRSIAIHMALLAGLALEA